MLSFVVLVGWVVVVFFSLFLCVCVFLLEEDLLGGFVLLVVCLFWTVDCPNECILFTIT